MADYTATSKFNLLALPDNPSVLSGYDGEDIYPDGEHAVTYNLNAGQGGSHRETYHYTDSNYAVTPSTPGSFLNANGSRVYFDVEDTWTSERLANNVIKVHVKTTIHKIWRGGIQGNPHGGGTHDRRLTVTLEPVWTYTWEPLNIAIEETIMSGGVTYEHDIILEPEASYNTSSVDIINKTIGYEGPGNADHFGAGISFKNNLPKEFSHKLVYHDNGGHAGPGTDEWTSKSQCENRTVTSIVPKNPHWIFKGWSESSTAKEGNIWAGNQVNVCEEKHLYATWHYTYRPGMVRHNGVWKSCDRDGATGPTGACNIRRGGKWVEMRIDPDNTGLNDPPCIHSGGSWRIMKLIGDEGREHNISWDCPHQWN